MTIEEKLEMYRGKKRFVASLASAFAENPKNHTVSDITYEVYQKEWNGQPYFCEWVIVHFVGGGFSPRRVTGNSSIANYRAIGDLLYGGYYDEVMDYKKLAEIDYKKVEL